MRKTVALFIAFVLIVSAVILPVHAIEVHDENAITFLSGKRGYSTISYNPSSYEYCKGNIAVNSNRNFEYDENGIIPVITLDTNNEITFSYDSSNIRNLWDDPVQQVLNIPLGASVRSGAIIVQKKVGTDNYQTMSIAVDVFREGAAPLAGFFKPDYTAILKGATYQIIVAYATVAKNNMELQRTVELYEVSLRVNRLDVKFSENLPDDVIANALGNVNSAEVLELYRIGGSLLNGSVTPYGFTMSLRNQSTKVEVSYNGGEYKPATDDNMQFTKQGKYSFRIQSCTGEVEERIIYITHPEKLFLETYFPMGIVKGERLFDLESELPVWSLNSKIELHQNNQFLPPLYGSLVNLDSGEEQTISPSSNTLHLQQSGRYFLTLRNVPSENTPGTHCVFSYVFQISSPSDPYTTFNLQNLREGGIISSYKAHHWEVDIYENNKLIHLCFGSSESARNVAAQYGTLAHERCWDYSTPERYSVGDASEVWLWANAVERELAKSSTQMLHSDFTFVLCEAVEVRGYSYSSGETKKIHFGVPIGEQIAQGRWRITELLSSGRNIEYDVYYADNNRVEYTLQYDAMKYTVSGERLHCVNSVGYVFISNILNQWDSEGVIKIESAAETLVLPIAQTTDITLEGGGYRLQFIDRLGQMVELGIFVNSTAPSNLVVTAENPTVAEEVATVSNKQFWVNTTFITLGSICGIGCCCGSIIYIHKMRRKRK